MHVTACRQLDRLAESLMKLVSRVTL